MLLGGSNKEINKLSIRKRKKKQINRKTGYFLVKPFIFIQGTQLVNFLCSTTAKTYLGSEKGEFCNLLKATSIIKPSPKVMQEVQGKGNWNIRPQKQQKNTPQCRLLLSSHADMHQQTWQLHKPTLSNVNFLVCWFVDWDQREFIVTR